MTAEWDDRTDDDLPPAAHVAQQITVGDGWTVEAANDGTVVFVGPGPTLIEVGFASAEDVFALVTETGRAGEAWVELDRWASRQVDVLPERPGPDLFDLFVQAQRDGQRIAS